MKKFLVFLVLFAGTACAQHTFPAQDTNNTFSGTNQFTLGHYDGPVTFANLPASPANGTTIYVSDGSPTTPCTGGGTGAVAYRINGAWNCSGGAGGSNTQVQFNDGGAFGGNPGFTFDKTTGALGVQGPTPGTDFAITLAGPSGGGLVPMTIHSPFANGLELYSHNSVTAIRAPTFNMFRSRGTQAVPSAVTLGDSLAFVDMGGYDGTGYFSSAALLPEADQTWTSTKHGTRLRIVATPNNTTGQIDAIDVVNDAGNNLRVGIKNNTPKFDLHTSTGPVALGAPAAAPTDGDLNSSNISFWIDEVNSVFKIRAKQSGGGLNTYNVPLAISGNAGSVTVPAAQITGGTTPAAGFAALGTTTVGALPAAAAGNAGQIIKVSDSTAIAAEGQTCAGGGAVTALAFSTGAAWKCF